MRQQILIRFVVLKYLKIIENKIESKKKKMSEYLSKSAQPNAAAFLVFDFTFIVLFKSDYCCCYDFFSRVKAIQYLNDIYQ